MGLLAILLFSPLATGGASLRPDENVVFFTTTATPFGQDWEVAIHGWVHEPEGDSLWRRALLKGLRRSLGLRPSAQDTQLFRERIGWFLVDNERGKRVSVYIGDSSFPMPPTGKDGHFRGRILLNKNKANALAVDGWLPLYAQEGSRRFHGGVHLTPDDGWMVVSDIDDTIKVTEVKSKKKLLANTFVRPFRAVKGMSEMYGALKEQGATFHYLSAAPWPLYPTYSAFLRDQGFPPGAFSMREFRMKDRRIQNIFRSPKRHKKDALQRLLNRYPKKRFILVGDAWENDPEVYGAIARKRPDQVRRVIIRLGSGDGWTERRAARAFRGINARAVTFQNPSDLPDDAKRLP